MLGIVLTVSSVVVSREEKSIHKAPQDALQRISGCEASTTAD